MRIIPLVSLIAILVLSVVLPVNASITTKAMIDDSLFITYDFESLDKTLYNQTKTNTQFNASTIPLIIVKNLEQKNQTQVKWGLGPQTNIYDDANYAFHISFFLSGSDIITSTVDRTSMKRACEVKTEWRKFRVNLTSDFSLNFVRLLAEPVAEWQKTNTTTFYLENKHTGTLDVFFYLILPASASNIQVLRDTITYDMPPYIDDQVLNSPFTILGAVAVVLVIVLIYRKAR